jgi:NRPS condensation-like uncharacterized protein
VTTTFRLTAWDCLQVLTKRFSDQQVRMVVECDARLDEARLMSAVRAAVAVEPVLGCRVEDRLFRPRWKSIAGLDAGSLLRVVPTSDPDTEIARLLAEDLDPWTGPVVRFTLVRGDRDSVVVNLDHTAGDAASVRSLTYLLATLYGRPDRVPAVSDRGAYFARRGFKALRPLMTRAGGSRGGSEPAGAAAPAWRFPWREGGAEFRKRFLVRRLAPARAGALRAFAAARNAWVNDVLVAAYFRALGRLVGDSAGIPRLTVPVDLRAYLSASQRPRIANYSASFEAELAGGVGGSFEETVRLVRAATAPEKEGRPGLAQAATLSRRADWIPFRIIQRRFAAGKVRMALPPPWFIALGTLQPDRLSFGPVAARHAYSLQSVGRAGVVFQLSASFFAEAVTLAVCFAGDDANEAIVSRFLDWFEAELPA